MDTYDGLRRHKWWVYFRNPGGLDRYVRGARLKVVELNVSLHRFRSQIK